MSTERLSYGAHTRALLALGLPMVGSQLSGLFLHMTDTVMIGRGIGVDELAAVVIGGTLWFVLFITGAGFGSIIAGPIASAMAQGNETEVRRLVRMAIWLSLGYAVLITPIFFLAEPILLAIGQKPNVAALAGDYIEIVGFSIYVMLVTNLLRAYLAALERTKFVLIASMSAVVFHIGTNVIFIFGAFGIPGMGVRGAAISSLITDSLLTLVLLIYAVRSFPQHHLLRNFWRIDREALRRVFNLGMPVGLQMLAEVGMFASAAVMMGWVSAEALAAHGIALQMASITFLVHMGVAQGATVRAGQAFGARDERQLRDGALVGVLLSMGFALASMSIFLSIPELLIHLFLSADDPAGPDVLRVGVPLVFMAAVFQIFDGGQAMVIGLLRGVQDTRVPMVVAVVCYWLIGIPTAYFLGRPEVWGGVGIWTGLVVGLASVWVALSWRFWRRRWITSETSPSEAPA